MPLIYLSYPEGSFTPENLTALANQMTRDGEELEGIPLTEWALSTTWIYAREYPKANVFHGGKPADNSFVTVDINVINGGYSAKTKAGLIQRVTDAVEKYGKLPQGEPRRVYVVIREVAEANWGFDGQSIDLHLLRNQPPNMTPL